jgi:hypothetical protein
MAPKVSAQVKKFVERLRNKYRKMHDIRIEIDEAFCHFLEGEEPTPPSPRDIVKQIMVSVPPEDDLYDDCTLSDCVTFYKEGLCKSKLAVGRFADAAMIEDDMQEIFDYNWKAMTSCI